MSSSDSVLLVEGKNDKHVVSHICKRKGGISEFKIDNQDGIDNVLQAISLEVKSGRWKTIGILVDADDDAECCWRKIVNILEKEGLQGKVQLPEEFDSEGTIICENYQAGIPRIGIWIMPNNEAPGGLEDFIATMMPSNDPVWPLSEGYIDSIPEGDRKFNNVLKAQVYAWLATRKKPPLAGLAIKEKELDIEGEICRKFIAWIRKLFGEL